MDNDDNKPNLVSIDCAKKPTDDDLYEGESIQFMLEHLDRIKDLVVEGKISQLVTLVESDSEEGVQIAFSGDPNNPYKMYYAIEKNIPSLYESIFLAADYDLEE